MEEEANMGGLGADIVLLLHFVNGDSVNTNFYLGNNLNRGN